MVSEMKKDRVHVVKLRYIEKDGELVRIKSKKDFENYFQSKKEIKKFIRKNKLSHKKEYDIAEALNYFQEVE